MKSANSLIPWLSFCNRLAITGFEIGDPLIISGNRWSKVSMCVALNRPGLDFVVVTVGERMSEE